MLIGFNLAPVVASIYWPQDQWVALLTATVHGRRGLLLPGLLVADRGVPRADLRLPALVALRRASSADQLGRRRRAAEADRPRPGLLGRRRRRPTGSASRAASSPTASSVVHGPSFSLTFILLVLPGVIALIAENTGHVKAVAEMTGDGPRPLHGPRDRRRRRRAPRWPASSAARRPRRTPRTSASWARPGSTRPRPTTWPRAWRSCSACARSSARSSTRPPAACSAASPSCSTA